MFCKKVGLLGGAFNPAHEGHVYISCEARRLLGLDEVWWLLSADHPAKIRGDMLPFEERCKRAEELTPPYSDIKISSFEREHNTSYTIDTVAALKQHFPEIRFIWMIGSDNFINLHKWHKWQELCSEISFAVFNREPYSRDIFNCNAAKYYGERYLAEEKALTLATKTPPFWCFLKIVPNPASSTVLRKKDLVQ